MRINRFLARSDCFFACVFFELLMRTACGASADNLRFSLTGREILMFYFMRILIRSLLYFCGKMTPANFRIPRYPCTGLLQKSGV